MTVNRAEYQRISGIVCKRGISIVVRATTRIIMRAVTRSLGDMLRKLWRHGEQGVRQDATWQYMKATCLRDHAPLRENCARAARLENHLCRAPLMLSRALKCHLITACTAWPAAAAAQLAGVRP